MSDIFNDAISAKEKEDGKRRLIASLRTMIREGHVRFHITSAGCLLPGDGIVRVRESADGRIFMPLKGRRSYGRYLASADDEPTSAGVELISVRSADKVRSRAQKIRETAARAARLMKASGLWESFVSPLEKISVMEDTEIEGALAMEWKKFYEWAKDEKLGDMSPGLFSSLQDGIKNIRFGRYRTIREQFAKDIADRKPSMCHTWREGYDNRLSSNCPSEEFPELRVWYSEEYKGCGNGHYYIAIDATHAMFREDD